MKIVRGKLTPNDLAPASLRYDPDTDSVQFSPDGGATWTADPSDDPRSAPKFLQPALTGDDIQCRAASNMVAHIQDTFGAISTATSAIQIAAGLLGVLLTFLAGAGVIFDLILAVAEAISSITLTVIEAAFTSEVYEQIKCILLCHLDAAGRITESGLSAAQSEINAACGATVGDVIELFVLMWGVNGFNNAGATGDAAHDCSECEACAWCYEWLSQAELLADSWTPTSGTFWNAAFAADLTKVSFTWTSDGVGHGGDSASAIWLSNAFVDRVAFYVPLSASPNPVEWTGTATSVAGGIAFGLNAASGSGGVVAVATLHLEGVGVRPAWTHGHEC